MGRGFYWFKLDLDMLQDPKVARVVDEWGAEGIGVWTTAMIVMHSSVNDGEPYVPVERLVRRVAAAANLTKNRAKKVLFSCKNAGLFDQEMWDEGKAMNERVAQRYLDYQRRCEQLAQARARRDGPGDSSDIKPES